MQIKAITKTQVMRQRRWGFEQGADFLSFFGTFYLLLPNKATADAQSSPPQELLIVGGAILMEFDEEQQFWMWVMNVPEIWGRESSWKSGEGWTWKRTAKSHP